MMRRIHSRIDPRDAAFLANVEHNRALAAELERRQHAVRTIRPERDLQRLERQGKMTVRARLEQLLDPGTPFLELSTLAAGETPYAEDAPGALEDEDDDQPADDEVGGARVARALDQVGLEDPVVGGQAEGAEGEQPVVPGQLVELPLPARRVEQEDEQQQETDVQRADHQAGERVKGGDDQLVDGEAQRGGDQHVLRQPAQIALLAVLVEFFGCGVVVRHAGTPGRMRTTNGRGGRNPARPATAHLSRPTSR